MKKLKKAYQILTKAEIWFVFIIFFFATAATVVNVVLRKLFAINLNWVDELSRFIMLITICLGMSIAVSDGSHPKMDTIQSLFKGKGHKAIVLVADVVFAVLLIWGAVLAIQQEARTIRTGADLTTIPLKLWVFWLFVPIGFTGGAIRCACNVVFDILDFFGKDPRKLPDAPEQIEEGGAC